MFPISFFKKIAMSTCAWIGTILELPHPWDLNYSIPLQVGKLVGEGN